MSANTMSLPSKFREFGDQCPHADKLQDTGIKVRVFATGLRYAGKCYQSCGCSTIIVEMLAVDAHRYVRESRGQYAPIDAVVTTPGAEDCGECGTCGGPVDPGPLVDPDPVEPQPMPLIGDKEATPVVKPAGVKPPVDSPITAPNGLPGAVAQPMQKP